MIEMTKLENANTRIDVIDPKTDTTLATIYAESMVNDVPGKISCNSFHGIHHDYIDEIERALQDAWRIAKGYIQVL